jgi:hypothetical protein
MRDGALDGGADGLEVVREVGRRERRALRDHPAPDVDPDRGGDDGALGGDDRADGGADAVGDTEAVSEALAELSRYFWNV